ncbi:FKBP-type peptidyl-prolyl cis-trans isomerase [Magnetofaba australis]|uniref:peptidylprolyl isomerase n=1 Tax=Magnetofaba australis IT-1 TaxID=1434232 RepID=A0A1Y2K755_9PROT|nr:peptidylprolyl isomerase [Magnetofaba australis]OSM05383.1 putative FKBP-type peptidyl-prolyl cis-trans isomerase [Magnetofaba australis IT-1]
MQDTIQDNKYVEVTYTITDQKSGQEITAVEFPIGYVHGVGDALVPAVTDQLVGKSVGDEIVIPIDCNEIYGPRDEGLVFTDYIENVPHDFRELGATITMENAQGQTRDFIVTRIDEKTLTVDGNNPLCGRKVLFTLKIVTVRDATEEELEAGGPVQADAPDVDSILMQPLN